VSTGSRWRDGALALGLFAATVWHEHTLPPALGAADESYFFQHGLRVLHGQAPYRDFFDLITPASFYLVAAVFGLFGASMETARLFSGAIEGGIAVAIFAACRLVGVGPALASAAAVAQIALFQEAWPFASPHWLSTLLLLVLLVGLARPLARGRAPSVWLGALAGVLVLVQQQRGALVAVGLPLLVLLDVAVTRGLGGAHPLTQPFRWFTRYVGAGACVVLPGLGLVVAAAGFWPVWEALVLYPLQNYAGTFRAQRWGAVAISTAAYARDTLPTVLRWLPLALAVDLGRLALAARRRDVAVARRLVLLLGVSGLAVASVWYYRDFIHVAFVAPILLVAAAEAITALLPPRGASAVVAAAVLIFALSHAARVRAARAAAHPVRHQTAFGEIAFQKSEHARLVDRLRALAADAGSDELFSYPTNARFYLLTGLRNPTRYSLLQPGYSSPEAFAEVTRTLEARRTPLVLVTAPFLKADDPFLAWLQAHYTRLEDPDVELATGLVVYRRNPDSAVSD